MFSKIKQLFSDSTEQTMSESLNKPYNIDLLKKSIANNTASLREILLLFIQHKPVELFRLEEAMHSQNLTAVARLAHSLKGNLYLFGMNETYEQLVWMERYAKTYTEWNSQLDTYWMAIKASFDQVLREIPQELDLLPAA